MPVVKIYSRTPLSGAATEAIAADLEQLCLQVLQAQPNAIQVVFLQVAAAGRGAEVLVEAHYRAQPYRDKPALEVFMDGVEASLLKHAAQQPRIRCFAVEGVGLSARH